MRKFKEWKKAAPCSQLGTRPASRCQSFRLLSFEATQCCWLPSFRLLQYCFSLTVCPVISSKWYWGWFGSMCFPLWFKDRISSKKNTWLYNIQDKEVFLCSNMTRFAWLLVQKCINPSAAFRTEKPQSQVEARMWPGSLNAAPAPWNKYSCAGSFHTLIMGMTVIIMWVFLGGFLWTILFPRWNDYTADIFNGFQKQELGKLNGEL